MTTPDKNMTPDMDNREPFIPPQYLLYVAIVGFLVALAVAFTQPEFNVVGYGGLGIAILSLLAWVLMAPDQAREVITGRTARFGGTSVVVTLVFLIALVGIYSVARGQDLRLDLTERDTFSLTDQSRTVVAALGADPSLPAVQLIAFYGAGQAGRRDQDTVLFDDYVSASDGKISYEFVDPDRNPQAFNLYGITRPGQIAVTALDEVGEPNIETAEIVEFFSQDELTNAILKVSASGDFRAYFLQVEGGLGIEASGQAPSFASLNDNLVGVYDWTTQEVGFLDLLNPNSEIELNASGADGEVLVIPGGSAELGDDELGLLTDYLDNGGSVIIFADNSFNEDATSLATSENLSNYLFENFGVRFENDVVIDTQAFQTPVIPFVNQLEQTSYITTNGIDPTNAGVIFELPHSITIADELPANVTVTALANSTPDAFAKTDIEALTNDLNSFLQGNITREDDDIPGPFTLAASAENSETGARVVLFSSVSLGVDQYALVAPDNLSMAFNSLIWATDFDSFFEQTNIVSPPAPQDSPIFADQQTLRNINFITIVVLPFGVLVIGVLVWLNNREREDSAA